jgi:biopolymer transport protein ExbB/TolQ
MADVKCAICGTSLQLDGKGAILPCSRCNSAHQATDTSKATTRGQNIGTQPNLLLAVAFALITTIAFYGAGPLTLLRETSVYGLFCGHGWVPYVSSLLFSVALWILLLKIPLINREWAAFRLQLLPEDRQAFLDQSLVDKVLDRINRLSNRQRRLLLVNRIRQSLVRLSQLGTSEGLDDVLKNRGDIDAGIVESSYAAPRFIIWAIPVLGFVGTVLGISKGVSAFSSLIQNASDLEGLRESLKGVTYGLGQAFETTMVALCMSLILMLIMSLLQKREDQLLAAVEEYCMEHLLHKVRSDGNGVTAQITEVLSSLLSAVQRLEKAIAVNHLEVSDMQELASITPVTGSK